MTQQQTHAVLEMDEVYFRFAVVVEGLDALERVWKDKSITWDHDKVVNTFTNFMDLDNQGYKSPGIMAKAKPFLEALLPGMTFDKNVSLYLYLEHAKPELSCVGVFVIPVKVGVEAEGDQYLDLSDFHFAGN